MLEHDLDPKWIILGHRELVKKLSRFNEPQVRIQLSLQDKLMIDTLLPIQMITDDELHITLFALCDKINSVRNIDWHKTKP